MLLFLGLLTIGFVMAEMGIKETSPGFLADDNGAGSGSVDEDSGKEGIAKETAVKTELETQNKGEDSQIQAKVQTQTMEGYKTMTNSKGEEVQVKTENGGAIKSNGVEAKTKLQLKLENDSEGNQSKNQSRIRVNLSNGRNAEVKVMPSTASERALSILATKGNFTIELKEVGKGNETKLAYEVETETEGKFLGLFKTRAKVKTQVSAETGEILRIKKPFLTSVKTTETAE